MENIVFQIEGGIGKNVMATAVVRAIHNKYQNSKIIIMTAHPDIWLCNPRVERVLEFGKTPYFYKDYILNKDVKLCIQDPYRHEDYILKRKHLTQVWCELCGVEWDGERPELYFTNLEFDFLTTIINKDSRPIFMIQPFGGAQGQGHKYSWARDLPPSVAQEVVNDMVKDHRVIQVRREDQLALQGVEYLSLNPRQLALTLMLSDKRLFIDSFMQHCAAALGLESVVTWVANQPEMLGYQVHQNITSSSVEAGEMRNSFYDPFDILGDPIQLASQPNTLFDSKEIIIAIRTCKSTESKTEYLMPEFLMTDEK